MEKTREIEQYLRWKFKLRVLEFAKDYGKVKETCEMFKVSKSSYFNWKRKYEEYGAEGLFLGAPRGSPFNISLTFSKLIITHLWTNELLLGWFFAKFKI